ncbi:MAG TPA: alginate lyase family protein [Planctomycetaceae bacterium]|nr:alginate lyase family protein [Planctomycetaceae bacterium]
MEGRFQFLNEQLVLPNPVDWRLSESPVVDPLWRFHLHYHEFLLDLLAASAASSSAALPDRAWDLVRQWIDGNPLDDVRGLDDAWHPFCISRRLPVWIILWQIAPPDEALAGAVAGSMFRQALFLASHLERDLGGNHLLENARGLALAGSFFSGPAADRWLRVSRKILRRELPEQILPHGEHFERAPMYHAQMLDILLDIRDTLRVIDPSLSTYCGDTAVRMAEFLEQILHPDGEIPLLGDSVLGETPPPHNLIRQSIDGHVAITRSVATPAAASRIGDYWIWRDGDNYLLLDAGPVGADHLPAHAHSDLSTIEASVGGKRLIVDSGVFAYRDGGLRSYCRSTAAHNLLQVDNREQCDTWSRFRMGYRGRPIDIQNGVKADVHWVRMRHDAYRRSAVPQVGRWIACHQNGPWVIVDWALGEGCHCLANWLHLHPDVQIQQAAEAEFRLRLDRVVLTLGSLTPGVLEILEGDYCPEFGHRMVAPVVRWTNASGLPAVCGWWFEWGEDGGSGASNPVFRSDGCLRWGSAGAEVNWSTHEIFGSAAPQFQQRSI